MRALHTRRFTFTFLSIALYSGLVQAGAWVQPEGEGQFILNDIYYVADERYDNDGNSQPLLKYRKGEINPYIEYGLTYNITIGASLSLQAASQVSSLGGKNISYNVGDSEFFARGWLVNYEGFVLSGTALVKAPTPGPTDLNPKIGSSHPDLGGGLAGGYGFKAFGLDHFIEATTLYRYRFGSPEDQINLSATLGARVTPNWMLMPQAFVTFRVKDPSTATFTQSSSDDYDEVKLQLTAVYAFTPDFSVQFGGFSTVDGKNIGKGKGGLISLWRSF